jgi:hypothetical protein
MAYSPEGWSDGIGCEALLVNVRLWQRRFGLWNNDADGCEASDGRYSTG